jgi:hypothetical protein
MFHARVLNDLSSSPYRIATTEVGMGILEIVAGVFLVSVPALVLADGAEQQRDPRD